MIKSRLQDCSVTGTMSGIQGRIIHGHLDWRADVEQVCEPLSPHKHKHQDQPRGLHCPPEDTYSRGVKVLRE